MGGRHKGRDDERDMFPQMVRAMRELKPRAVVIENVKGLLRQSFARYFEYVVLQISYPEITARPAEDWTGHLSRLERHHSSVQSSGLFYRVAFRLLNAADHGVPQRRERVFIVALRQDLELEWSFPKATHSLDALLWDQWVTGEYRERHEVSAKQRPEPPRRLESLVALFPPQELPWTTARDAISDSPDPEEQSSEIRNHSGFNRAHARTTVIREALPTNPRRRSKPGSTAARTCSPIPTTGSVISPSGRARGCKLFRPTTSFMVRGRKPCDN